MIDVVVDAEKIAGPPPGSAMTTRGCQMLTADAPADSLR